MKIYHIADNGSNPFDVHMISKKKLKLIINKTKKELEFNYLKCFIGERGTTILFLIKKKKTKTYSKFTYIHVGWKVIQFETDEPIEKYNSYVGNSYVPYSAAYSKTLTYFLEECKILPGHQTFDELYHPLYKNMDIPKLKHKVLIKRQE